MERLTYSAKAHRYVNDMLALQFSQQPVIELLLYVGHIDCWDDSRRSLSQELEL
jgi:hypothetical protein